LKDAIPPELEPTTVAVLRVMAGAVALFGNSRTADVREVRHVAKVTNESILLGLMPAMDQQWCYEAILEVRQQHH
jgi:hypothetical protein